MSDTAIRRAGALIVVAAAVVAAGCSSGTGGRPESTPSSVTSRPPVSVSITRPSPTSTVDPPTSTSSDLSTTTTAASTTTSAPATSTTPSTTAAITTTTPSTTAATTTTTVATSGSSSTPWGWIIAGIAVAVAVVALILLLMQRSRRRALQTWRIQSRPALEDAHLALGLVPASEHEIIDRGHWQSVRQRIEEAAASLDTAAAASPAEPGRLAARQAAEGLRGLMFALESGLLLREAPVSPTGDQLMQADAAARARRAEAQSALDQLDRMIRGTPPVP